MDWHSSDRIDTFEYWRARKANGLIEDVEPIIAFSRYGGSVKHNVLTALKVSATLPYTGRLNIGNDYIRIYSISCLANDTVRHLHGTFVASSPSTEYGNAVATGSVECYGLLLLLQDTATDAPICYKKGSAPIAEARKLAESVGLAVAIDGNSQTSLSSPRNYDAGSTYLDVVNDLLSVAGYSSATVDPNGTVRFTPYQLPENMLITETFADDEHCIYAPAIEYEFDTFCVPNKLIAIKSNSQDDAPMVAVAYNMDPLSSFSIPNKGREITVVETVSDCEDSEALKKIAESLLKEKSSAVESIVFEHSFVPNLVGNAVLLNYAKHGVYFSGIVVTEETQLSPGMRCKTRLRRFVRM